MLEGIRVKHRTAYDKMCPAGHIAGVATYVIVVDCNRHRNTQLSQSSLGIPLLIQISAIFAIPSPENVYGVSKRPGRSGPGHVLALGRKHRLQSHILEVS